jgi:hypothetical protein
MSRSRPTRCSSSCTDWAMSWSGVAAVRPESTVTSSSTAPSRVESSASAGPARIGHHQLPAGVGVQADRGAVGTEPPWLGTVYRRSPQRRRYDMGRNLLRGKRLRPHLPFGGQCESIHGSSWIPAPVLLCHQLIPDRGRKEDAKVRVVRDLCLPRATSRDRAHPQVPLTSWYATCTSPCRRGSPGFGAHGH